MAFPFYKNKGMMGIIEEGLKFPSKNNTKSTDKNNLYKSWVSSKRAQSAIKTAHILNTQINPEYFFKKANEEKILKGYGFLTGSKRFNKSVNFGNPGPGDYNEYQGTIMEKVLNVKKRKKMLSVKNIYLRRKKKKELKVGANFLMGVK